MMQRFKSMLLVLMLVALTAFMLTGCGESVTHKTTTTDGGNTGGNTGGDDGPTDTTPYPNATLLFSADDLATLLTGEATAAATTGTLIVIDTRSADAYAAGHIPGAIHMAHSELADGSLNLKSVADLEALLSAKGLVTDAKIVLYDDTITSWGSAGRVFWALEYLGCTDVHLLNGGWDKWSADGRTTELAANTLEATTFTASAKPSVVIDKETIASRLGDNDFVLIDTRTDEEYNGWQLYGEAREGHITGAVHLPYEWSYADDLTLVPYTTMKAYFDARGITADKQVAAYCTAGIRSGFAYFLARLMGFENVANYDASMWDWAAANSTTYPMEALPNYADLVYPGWVKGVIDYHAASSTSAAPANYSYDRDHKYLIFETQWGSFSDMANGWADASYLDGHIPGAIHSNSDVYENGYPRWFMLPDDELKAAVGNMGITEDTTVIVYSNSPIFAARLWWILLYAGVDDVRLLNGGYDAWAAAGYDGETTINEPVATTYNGSTLPEVVATTDYVADVYDNAHTLVADVRMYEEYAGEVSGYSYVVNKGRIPGATYAFHADNPDREYLDDDGTFRNYSEVATMWNGIGIENATDTTFSKEVIFYCGSGYRSSISYLYAHLMGISNVRNYSDGWEGWSTNYVEDASYFSEDDVPGSTDGWRQERSVRPVSFGVHPEWDFDAYPNVNHVVDARWVKEVLLENNNFDKPYVIAEVGWGPAGDAYNNGHVPGAIHVNTDEIEYDCFNARNDWPVDAGDPACWDRSTTEEQDAAKGLGPDDSLPRNWWNIYPDQYLLPGIAYMGIDKETTVVVYGSDQTAAARLVWTLLYAGVEDVRLMEGGYAAWEAAGYEGSTETAERTPVDEFDPEVPGRSVAINSDYKSEIPYVRDVVSGVEADGVIVDIRTWDEYIGDSENGAPYSYIPTIGRIPGALWGKAGDGPWTMEAYVNSDNTLVAPAQIETYWTSQGITSDKALSYYCGTGWRSSLAWFYGYMMGYERNYNFDSGWFEWSMGEGSDYAGADPVLNPIVIEGPE
ncbi:rhodanese-like domain-containing protein [uncultured Desulfuromonas sp.]|uniref:sulfurtransferase n=1 Tax=uncultured Desulfuromonas sp. TaxID=181013 RepID=UPI002AABFD39|nr:rhodanese-like domain-containing protein [uncultured Desulfuromonas sp.]